MRHLRLAIYSMVLITGIMVLSTDALAARGLPQTNIRINFGVWDVPGSDLGITVHNTDLGNGEELTDVQVSGMSGAISFSHSLGRRFAWEISAGGFSDSESQVLSREIESRHRYRDDYYDTISSNTHTVSVSYLTMGLIYYPLNELAGFLGGLHSFVRPYLTAGIGPYFGWDATWSDDNLTDADFASTMGAYPGVGLDMLLSRHFLFNLDLRYQFVEFGDSLKGLEDYSGLNVVAGFKIAF